MRAAVAAGGGGGGKCGGRGCAAAIGLTLRVATSGPLLNLATPVASSLLLFCRFLAGGCAAAWLSSMVDCAFVPLVFGQQRGVQMG